ncbi:MAG: diacylglycerol kinase family protein [Actinomycetes bacterium]
MTTAHSDSPSAGRRLFAVLALLATAALVVEAFTFIVSNLVWLVVLLAGLALAVAGVWWVLTERLPRRAIGIAGLIAGAVIIVVALMQAVGDSQRPLLRIAIVFATLAVAAMAGRAALTPDLRELDRLRRDGRARPRKPVLLCNPWSGGGKVAKFGLLDIAKEMGVETVLLDHGLDLAQLARDAIARGADCLGMAGGDGSQALVASIANEHDLPFVCISAGTRNHFAQDLGFDKEDPRKGMTAFRDGVERFIDFATVGDRLFVNNVSLGIYATIVQQDSYRDAKLETSRNLLPEMLGSQAEPFDLQFTTPDGAEVADSFLIMVSNNPYILGPSLDVSQRRSMDTGTLGVFAVNAASGHEAAAVVTRTALGVGGRDPHLHQFTAETFEVRSRSGKAFAGVDGEALELDTPLEFRSHPRALRMLVPVDVLVEAERRRSRGFSPGALFGIALGRPSAALAGAERMEAAGEAAHR